MDQSIIVKTPRRYVARSVWHNRSGQVTQPLARARNYANFLHVPGFNIIETPEISLHICTPRRQRWARVWTGSDWIRTEANFWRIRTGSDCNFFLNWRITTGSDSENFCCFNVIILKISKILVVIRFHTGLPNGSVYFAIKCKNSTGTILQFELYPPLFTYNVEV